MWKKHPKALPFLFFSEMWERFGYPTEYIRRMADQEFWDEEAAKIPDIDRKIVDTRGPLESIMSGH